MANKIRNVADKLLDAKDKTRDALKGPAGKVALALGVVALGTGLASYANGEIKSAKAISAAKEKLDHADAALADKTASANFTVDFYRNNANRTADEFQIERQTVGGKKYNILLNDGVGVPIPAEIGYSISDERKKALDQNGVIIQEPDGMYAVAPDVSYTPEQPYGADPYVPTKKLDDLAQFNEDVRAARVEGLPSIIEHETAGLPRLQTDQAIADLEHQRLVTEDQKLQFDVPFK